MGRENDSEIRNNLFGRTLNCLNVLTFNGARLETILQLIESLLALLASEFWDKKLDSNLIKSAQQNIIELEKNLGIFKDENLETTRDKSRS